MSLDNPRVQFYLRHREQFAEWFALRSEAGAARDEWLIEMQPEVAALATDLGDDVRCHPETGDEQPWPGLYLVRGWWPTGAPGLPMLGLQWARRKTLLIGSETPWVGVRADRKQALGRAIYESPALQAARKSRKDTATQWWQALRYLPPEMPFPERAAEYRASLLKEIRSAWEAYSPSLDAALAQVVVNGTQSAGATDGVGQGTP
jgi:hypothetical protein